MIGFMGHYGTMTLVSLYVNKLFKSHGQIDYLTTDGEAHEITWGTLTSTSCL